MNLLKITDPAFLKDLTIEELYALSDDIRSFLIESIQKTGGHLASNLGVVELTTALLRETNKEDHIVYDVGHQSYTHKILTGRADAFGTLRQLNGLSGFPKYSESEYDAFETGHSSTSISALAGFARVRALNHSSEELYAVIGDGALTGGMSFEALNYLGEIKEKVIVIVNDNEFSIDENIGALSNALKSIQINHTYLKFKKFVPKWMRAIAKTMIKDTAASNVFRALGYQYIGPIDGHSYEDLIEAIHYAQASKESIILHVKTIKGKGHGKAEENATKYHGIGYFKIEEEDPGVSFSQTISNILDETKPDDFTIITPAMIHGSGLNSISDDHTVIDVGIAEAHAATMAAAIASKGKPVWLSLYATFAQRAYDSILHDIARADLPVMIGIDRAGIVPFDGDTHQGVFDVGIFLQMPNMTLTMPMDQAEAKALIEYGYECKHPFVIRYPKSSARQLENKEQIKKPNWLKLKTGSKGIVISYGPVLYKLLEWIEEESLDLTVYNARFLKPIDEQAIIDIKKSKMPILIYEEVMRSASLGTYLMADTLKSQEVTHIALDEIPSHGSLEDLRTYFKLDEASIKKALRRLCA